jgi:hypothetical protein
MRDIQGRSQYKDTRTFIHRGTKSLLSGSSLYAGYTQQKGLTETIISVGIVLQHSEDMRRQI